MGDYQIVLSLLSSLDHGRQMKRLVDAVIDTCKRCPNSGNDAEYIGVGGAVVNLRENVIEYRIKYSVSAMDDKSRQGLLEKALRSVGLQRHEAIRSDRIV